MEREKVEGSSTIADRGYTPETRTLEVGFHNRKGPEPYVYRYYDVPVSVWVAWLSAASAGAYFSAEIKGKFSSTKVS